MQCKKGYVRKEGRCVRKKSNSPFRMWGSWVGLILALLIPIPIIGFQGMTFRSIIFSVVPQIFTDPATALGFVLVYIIGYAILGFLVGFGVHSLIRRFRRGRR